MAVIFTRWHGLQSHKGRVMFRGVEQRIPHYEANVGRLEHVNNDPIDTIRTQTNRIHCCHIYIHLDTRKTLCESGASRSQLQAIWSRPQRHKRRRLFLYSGIDLAVLLTAEASRHQVPRTPPTIICMQHEK